MDKWSRVVIAFYEIWSALAAAASVLDVGTLQQVLEVFREPEKYDRDNLEAIDLHAKQRPLRDFLISMMEKDRAHTKRRFP